MMKSLPKTILLSLSLLFLASVANANSSHWETAEKLIITTNLDKTIYKTMHKVQEMIGKKYERTNLSSSAKQIMTKYNKKIWDLMEKEMGWEIIKNDVISILVNTYTEDELNQIIQFYSSPVGQKVLSESPKISERMTQISQKKLQEISPQLQEISHEMQKELDKTLTN